MMIGSHQNIKIKTSSSGYDVDLVTGVGLHFFDPDLVPLLPGPAEAPGNRKSAVVFADGAKHMFSEVATCLEPSSW
jgi:hypothetical protein